MSSGPTTTGIQNGQDKDKINLLYKETFINSLTSNNVVLLRKHNVFTFENELKEKTRRATFPNFLFLKKM